MRKISFFLIFSLIGGFVTAQNVSFGIKSGLNLYSLRGEDNYDFQLKAGFHIGAFADFQLSDWFAIQSELVYSRQGARQEITVISLDGLEDPDPIHQEDEVVINFNLDYINFPILAKFYPHENINLFLGPQVGFLVSAKEKINDDQYESSHDISETLRKLNFDLVFGAGYDFDFGLMFQAKYNWGLTNINKMRFVENGEVLGHPTLKNGGFQFSVGYRF